MTTTIPLIKNLNHSLTDRHLHKGQQLGILNLRIVNRATNRCGQLLQDAQLRRPCAWVAFCLLLARRQRF